MNNAGPPTPTPTAPTRWRPTSASYWLWHAATHQHCLAAAAAAAALLEVCLSVRPSVQQGDLDAPDSTRAALWPQRSHESFLRKSCFILRHNRRRFTFQKAFFFFVCLWFVCFCLPKKKKSLAVTLGTKALIVKQKR